MPEAEICRKAGISALSDFYWKKMYVCFLTDETRGLKALEV